MNDVQKLAAGSIAEICRTETKMNRLIAKKKWILNVKKDLKQAAFHYFEIFDNLAKFPSTENENWEKFCLLIYFGVNPLSVKNDAGLNPLEYFYKKNREVRLSLHDLSTKHHHLADQNERRFLFIANRLYHTFKDFGLSEEQLDPIHKSQNLWQNYQKLIHKQADTQRVAFSRLLKTVMHHPEDAVGVDSFEQIVQQRLSQEEQEEKKAIEQWRQWAEKDYQAQFSRPELGHARGYSSFDRGLYGMFDGWKQYLLYQPMPESSSKALDDFLHSLRDLTVCNDTCGLVFKEVKNRWVKDYQRALNPPKKFERTR